MSNSLHATLMASHSCLDEALDAAGWDIHAAFGKPRAPQAPARRADGVATVQLYDLSPPAPARPSLWSRLIRRFK